AGALRGGRGDHRPEPARYRWRHPRARDPREGPLADPPAVHLGRHARRWLRPGRVRPGARQAGGSQATAVPPRTSQDRRHGHERCVEPGIKRSPAARHAGAHTPGVLVSTEKFLVYFLLIAFYAI